ncbi:ribonuclease III [Bacteroidales bacterium OttesenSCG-928-M11]|nr:ribonuclease III [Bacteroidales bacterium OttesenSCG-928-M11]
MIRVISNRIKLSLGSKREFCFSLKNILGFFPGNIVLYEEALIHKSSSRENADGRYTNNERLEFLGDAVLDTVVADILYKKYPSRSEGFLTNTRSKIVKRETLDKVATELGLKDLITSSTRLHSQKNHILGNALEAFIGAVYLDKGYDKTYKFIKKKIIENHIDIETLVKQEVNFKSKLLEWSQKYKVNLDYELLDSFQDQDHNTVFQSQVLLNGVISGVGIGYSKKESQQHASRLAMKKIKYEKGFEEQILSVREEEPVHESIDIDQCND